MINGLLDLITGRSVPAAQHPVVPGQWALLKPNGVVQINGIIAAHGDRLVARRDSSWSVELPSGLREAGAFEPGLAPGSLEIEALEQMSEVFEGKLGGRSPWQGWAEMSPLAPKLHEHLHQKPFEHTIATHLKYLEAVCSSPRSHLRLEADLVPTARARKLARNAITRLASHREDWERPTVLGVRPRRVLCVVPEVELDLYENRVAARLVDHLRVYLQGRLEKLTRIRRMIDQSADHSEGAARGHHRRRDRLYQLWADAVQDNSAAELAAQTTAKLEAMYVRVLGLIDSPLYRAVPRGALVTGLKYTNIFLNDRDYRKVALLWKRWSEEGLERPKSDKAVYERQQRVCSAMEWFTWLLVVRAAEQLKLAPDVSSSTTPVDDIAIRLDGPVSTCVVTPPRDGVVILQSGEKRIRILGLPVSLTGQDAASTMRRIQDLDALAAGAVEDVVIALHLTQPRPDSGGEEWRVASTRLSAAGAWEPSVASDSKLTLLAVSPWDIGSVERLARCLRWHLHAPLLLSYPPRAHCSMPREIAGQGWIVAGNGRDNWRVLRKPRGKDLTLDALISAAKQDSAKASASAGGKATKYAARDAEKRCDLLREQIEQAITTIDRMQVCPVCWETEGQLVPLDERTGSFRVSCPACSSHWGVYACRCGESFPFLEPQSFERLLESDPKRDPGWVDLILGADALAVPCELSFGRPSLVCPKCKSCTCSIHRSDENGHHA